MIKAIFTEINEEFGHQMIIGEKELRTNKETEAHEKAKPYADTLSEVRGKQVNYMLEQNGGILVSIK